MTTPQPTWVKGYGVSYEDIVNSWGYEVVHFETFGDYQGDHIVVLDDAKGSIGLVVIGYGSCSGCDTLEAIAPWDDEGDWTEVVQFSERLKEDIHWEPSREGIRDWIDGAPENHWWSYDREITAWLNANLGTHLKESG